MAWNDKKVRRGFITLSVAAAAFILSGYVFAKEPEPPKGDVYPLKICVVTGKPLGSMGAPVIYDHQGREIRFCCKACVKKFKDNTATYIKKIDGAIVKQQIPYYPLDTCVVTGAKLGGKMGKPINYVHKNRLVRFCCKGCLETFQKDPDKYLKTLCAAYKAGSSESATAVPEP